MARRVSKDVTDWLYSHSIPYLWLDCHVDLLVRELKERAWNDAVKSLVNEECRKLDAFAELLCNSNKAPLEAEKEVYQAQDEFYRESDKVRLAEKRMFERLKARDEARRQKEAERLKRKQQKELKEAAKKALFEANRPLFEAGNCIQEKGLSKAHKDHLLSEDYARIKVSPFGDSGAAFFWVKTRWHESKEHAFFCYLIENLARKAGAESVSLNVEEGPDVEFEFDRSHYAFEVETGGNLRRNEKYVRRKFYKNQRNYEQSFVFVTSKKLKYKYGQYAHVVTRATIKKTLAQIFQKKPVDRGKAA